MKNTEQTEPATPIADYFENKVITFKDRFNDMFNKEMQISNIISQHE